MLQSVTGCYCVLWSATECYRELKSVTKRYKVLQGVTEYCRVLQSITKTNLAHLLGPIFGLVFCKIHCVFHIPLEYRIFKIEWHIILILYFLFIIFLYSIFLWNIWCSKSNDGYHSIHFLCQGRNISLLGGVPLHL